MSYGQLNIITLYFSMDINALRAKKKYKQLCAKTNCPLGININRNKLHKNKILPVGH